MAAAERRCLVSGRVRATDDMVRFVVGPDGTVVPDIDGKLPGRGHWVTADRAALDAAVGKGRLAKAARRHHDGPVTVPDGLADRTASLLRDRVLSLIGMARRAGIAIAGFDALVRAAGKGADIAVLVEAADAAPDGTRKLRARLGGAAVFECLARDALSRALGRDNVTHVGLKRSRLTDKIQLEMTRLTGLARGPEG